MVTVTSELRRHLVDSRLAGHVATTPAASRRNCRKLVAGDPDYTFGLSDWRDADLDDVTDAVVELCGPAAVADDPEAPGYIDPERSLAGVDHHRQRLAEHAARASRVLLATGHPTGLLGHYIELARALSAAGCAILTPLDDRLLARERDRPSGVRYVAGVGCAWNGADLLHTHRSQYMEHLLEDGGEHDATPDLVVADHGMAGAAIEGGIETLSIADVNDPALMLACVRGRTEGVLVIDDNLAPRTFRPVTAAMLDGLGCGG